jgi:xylan 1,4-beta-xylosidase
MSYWTFSDVFEEQGVVKTPFYGGFGLIAAGGIPKPAFNAFALLHRLGSVRLELEAEAALFTRRADGGLVLALWNYAPPGEASATRRVTLRLKGSAARTASIIALDAQHGDVHVAYESMGSPRYPTPQQLDELRHAAATPPPVVRTLVGGEVQLAIPPYGLALVTLE